MGGLIRNPIAGGSVDRKKCFDSNLKLTVESNSTLQNQFVR
jgi:hypothetical protein